MHSVVDQWKYIFKNLLFVLPFAVAPALFLSLSTDSKAVSALAKGLILGPFEPDFTTIFRTFSFFRTDSFLGSLYSVFALLCIFFFGAMLISFVEKHMRIGKRTFGGILSEVKSQYFSFLCFVLLYFAIYELWALVLSAVLYLISRIGSKIASRIVFCIVTAIFIGVLLYLVTIIYLWLPCKLQTGLKAISSLLYSYQLIVGVRGKLFLSLLLSYLPSFLILFGCAFAPEWVSRIVAVIVYLFCFLSFNVRMETLYFETDRLDREDLILSYMEL